MFDDPPQPNARARRSALSYRAGLAAESIAERHYNALGYQTVATRWRGPGGEIDLILRLGDETVFVEVKKARCFASAAESLSKRQMARIAQSVEDYACKLPQGRLSQMRIDVALVDGTGALEILENAFGA